jgi:hypothetical protein
MASANCGVIDEAKGSSEHATGLQGKNDTSDEEVRALFLGRLFALCLTRGFPV